jgi:hypothetical protein
MAWLLLDVENGSHKGYRPAAATAISNVLKGARLNLVSQSPGRHLRGGIGQIRMHASSHKKVFVSVRITSLCVAIICDHLLDSSAMQVMQDMHVNASPSHLPSNLPTARRCTDAHYRRLIDLRDIHSHKLADNVLSRANSRQ